MLQAGAAPGTAVDDDFAPEVDWPEPPDTRIPVTVAPPLGCPLLPASS